MFYISLVLRVLLGGAVMAAVLFAAAGRLDLPAFWGYVAIWTAFGLAVPLAVDPARQAHGAADIRHAECCAVVGTVGVHR